MARAGCYNSRGVLFTYEVHTNRTQNRWFYTLLCGSGEHRSRHDAAHTSSKRIADGWADAILEMARRAPRWPDLLLTMKAQRAYRALRTVSEKWSGAIDDTALQARLRKRAERARRVLATIAEDERSRIEAVVNHDAFVGIVGALVAH